MGQLAAQANHGPNAEDDDDGGNIAMVTTKLRHLYQPTTVQTRLNQYNFDARVLHSSSYFELSYIHGRILTPGKDSAYFIILFLDNLRYHLHRTRLQASSHCNI